MNVFRKIIVTEIKITTIYIFKQMSIESTKQIRIDKISIELVLLCVLKSEYYYILDINFSLNDKRY